MEATNPKIGEGITIGTRCACDSVDCRWNDGHDDCSHWPNGGIPQCLKAAICVVVLRYPGKGVAWSTKPGSASREVRLPMCRECAEWWTTHEHDGVTARLQITPEQKHDRIGTMRAVTVQISGEDYDALVRHYARPEAERTGRPVVGVCGLPDLSEPGSYIAKDVAAAAMVHRTEAERV